MNKESKIIHKEYPGGIRAYIDLTAEELAEFEKIIKENPQFKPWECMELMPHTTSLTSNELPIEPYSL